MKFGILTLLLCFIISSSTCYTYIGTEETLRQNIADLRANKLKFSDENLPSYEDELSDITPKNHSKYDFIIIGAGSAGATVASRLSEIEHISVLLIEAGSKEYPIMDIPLNAVPLQDSDQINWKYRTETSNKSCLGFTDASCKWPRGKVLGGGSVLNYMVATRGNKLNYDEWASITNDNSWSYDSMLLYFKKLEDFNVTGVPFDREFHHKGGPLHISSAPYTTELADAFLEAGQELGFPVVDYNGRDQIGFSYLQQTVIHGERWSANRAYLHSAKNRKNLFLTRDSHVNKILTNERTGAAYGVQFSKFGKKYVVKATKEIILCAGAINSPQLLMLSGIGPSQHLRDFRIPVIKNAPVGENLMDNIIYYNLVFKTNISVNSIESNILDPRNSAIKEYITSRNGTLALGVGYEALAFLNVDNLNSSSENANIEFIFGPNTGLRDPSFSHYCGLSEYYRDQMVTDNQTSSWTIATMLTLPKSRGRLLLRSKDPNDKPRLYDNSLDHPDDVRVMIKAIRILLQLAQTKAFQKYNSQLYDTPSLCPNYTYDSDDYWECAIRTFGYTAYHQSGTCKMGREDDKTSVVNSKLQVIGVKGLRVCDASVMPTIITGHTNVPTIAIAEKLSDIVKECWGFNNLDY